MHDGGSPARVYGRPGTTGSAAIEIEPIGTAHTPWTQRSEVPRQPDPDGPTCTIEVLPRYRDALLGVDELDAIDVLLWFDRADRTTLRAHRRGDRSQPERGVFALRAPDRPNPIAVSRVQVVGVRGGSVVVRGLDAVDGTPVLDLKPAR